MSYTKYGLQSSVIGFDDPFTKIKNLKRTGEGMFFPSQDFKPSKKNLISFIKALGLDFYLHMAMPNDKEIKNFIDIMDNNGIKFFLGNEFGSINGPYTLNTNRYDFSYENVEYAKKSKNFLGLQYDESEHLQLHPKQYLKDIKLFQWANPDGKDNESIFSEIVNNVSKIKNKYNTRMICENVFPTLYHTFAKGGFDLCPKLLKEEYQSIQLATAMGACKQYNRDLFLCIDLWGFDVGNWFTRLWGFPAHSPNEFKNILKLAHYICPHSLFVENIDSLAISTKKGFVLTEFGEIYKEFLNGLAKQDLNYTHKDIICDIAVIHADNGVFSRNGTFDGKGAFGKNTKLKDNECDIFDIFYSLSSKTISPNGTSFWNTEFDKFETGKYPRNEQTIKQLPLLQGVDKEKETSFHTLFYPLNNVLLFDHTASFDDFGTSKLIIAGGDRLSDTTKKDILKAADNGIKVLARKDLINVKHKDIIYCNSFKDDLAQNIIYNYKGKKDEWNIRFKNTELKITNPLKDGNTLEIELDL